MSLTKSQKKYLSRNVCKVSLQELSRETKVSEKEIISYLKNIWGDSKYQRYISEKSSEYSSQPDQTNAPFKHVDTINMVILVLVVIMIYANALNNVFLSDDFGILQNKNLGTLKDITSQPFNFARPLLFMIAVKIGGVIPITFRIINVLLHIGAVSTLYYILKSQFNRSVAFLAGLLVAVHPMFVESVTWISGGGYVQYSFFFLLSLYFYIKSTKKRLFLGLSYVAFFLSLASSVTAGSLVLIFPLYEFIYGSIKKSWIKSLPFFAMTGLYVFLTFSGGIQERQVVLEQTSYQNVESMNLFIKIPFAISNYIQLIVWPQNLTLYHSETSMSYTGLAIHVGIFIVSLLALTYLYIKKRKLFFWGSIFFVGLLPTLLSPGVAWVVAERYAYISTVGVLVVVAYYSSQLLKNKKITIFISVMLAIVILGYMVRTIVRNIDWKNEDNLWIATGKTSPSDPKTHNNLGDVYSRQGDLNRAAEEFSKAIELNPNYADAYHNLGNVYQRAGSPSAALQLYSKAYEINPNLWQSLQQIAFIHFQNQDFETAVNLMKQAIEISPSNPSLYVNMGIMYKQLGDVDSARASYIQALEIDPENETATQAFNELPL